MVERSVPDAMLWVNECDGPMHTVPEGKIPGIGVVVVDPILNGAPKEPIVICQNIASDSSCKLAPEKECIFKSKGAPITLNPHLYLKLA